MADGKARITELTRRKISDFLSLSGQWWPGRLEEVDFLGRIYDLANMPSTDTRYEDAARDIVQHRSNNLDWEDNWIFSDPRFGLRSGPDETFLRFLAETIHPLVRADEGNVATLLKGYNEALARDDWELYPAEYISGHAIYGWRKLGSFHGTTPELRLEERPLTDPSVLQEHLVRIREGLAADPAAAISASKALLESLFKLILDRSNVEYPRADDVPQLYRKVAELLALNAEAVPESARGSKVSQQILRTLVTTVQQLAELRNELGIDHGQSSRNRALARHARLALNSTVTVTEFLLDTWQARIDSGALVLPEQ